MNDKALEDIKLAESLAYKFNAGQRYGKEPYTKHLEAVATSVMEAERDDRLPVIGLLHDILEDTAMTEAVLRSLFDKDIVNAVVALTKVADEPYEAYIERVRGNALALKVKMHDSLCNLKESMVRGDKKRILKYSKQLQLLAA